MACTIDLYSLPVLVDCPEDDELMLFLGVAGQTNGLALRTWGKIKECLATAFLADGILIITGDDLNGSNQYINTDLASHLVIFYNGVNRFILQPDEWTYIVNGVQILPGFTFNSNDIFVIFPNPNGNT